MDAGVFNRKNPYGCKFFKNVPLENTTFAIQMIYCYGFIIFVGFRNFSSIYFENGAVLLPEILQLRKSHPLNDLKIGARS